MLDLETLSTRPHSVILVIGAIKFNRDGDYKEDIDEKYIDNMDYWVLKSILEGGYSSNLIVLEFNPNKYISEIRKVMKEKNLNENVVLGNRVRTGIRPRTINRRSFITNYISNQIQREEEAELQAAIIASLREQNN